MSMRDYDDDSFTKTELLCGVGVATGLAALMGGVYAGDSKTKEHIKFNAGKPSAEGLAIVETAKDMAKQPELTPDNVSQHFQKHKAEIDQRRAAEADKAVGNVDESVYKGAVGTGAVGLVTSGAVVGAVLHARSRARRKFDESTSTGGPVRA
jgi:hypothetical protein